MKHGLGKGSTIRRKQSDLTLAPNLNEKGGIGPLRRRRPVYVDPCLYATMPAQPARTFGPGLPTCRLGATRRPGAS